MPSFTSTNTDGVVTAQFDKTNTTPAAIPGIDTFALAAGRSYTFSAEIAFAWSISGGFNIGFTGTATATTFAWTAFVIGDGLLQAVKGTSLSDSFAASVGGTAGLVRLDGYFKVNAAGTFGLDFCQNLASGTSSVLIGSHMEVLQREA